MKFIERKDKIELPPIDVNALMKDHKFSTRMTPFFDNEHTIWGSRYMDPKHRGEFEGIWQAHEVSLKM